MDSINSLSKSDASPVQWMYRFDELKAVESLPSVKGRWDGVVNLLGGKGAGLFRMAALQLPVPPGFTITTDACAHYQTLRANASASASAIATATKSVSLSHPVEFLMISVKECVAAVEKRTGRKFGGCGISGSNSGSAESVPPAPLFFSCRSGARISMPGMMDTVLNIGLNDSTVKEFTKLTGNGRFVLDSYRRLIQGFGSIVLNIDPARFESELKLRKQTAGYTADTEMSESDWTEIVSSFKEIIRLECKKRGASASGGDGLTEFPQDVWVQLRSSIGAVFNSWNSERAIAYRNKLSIPHTYGTACTIQSMVFGNTSGSSSCTGVAFTRSPSTGERKLFGDFLINAQGEDVVAGLRNTTKISEMGKYFPDATKRFVECCSILETHFRNMQDVEFTIENNTLYMLQCRNGKRTAKAQVVIAIDMVKEGLITREEAIRRISPEDVNTLLLPQLDTNQLAALASAPASVSTNRLIARGVNASPGGAVGQIVFDAETARTAKEKGKKVILIRQFTKPEDVVGFFASEGVLTAEGGATSHAAVVARQFGLPCIVGASQLQIDSIKRTVTILPSHPPGGGAIDSKTESKCNPVSGACVLKEWDWISLDATRGDVYSGQLTRVAADFSNEKELQTVLSWCDEVAAANGGLQVLTNADSGVEAVRARAFGCRGIGLCRTEHTFFEKERLPLVTEMRRTFTELLTAMDGLPVTIRTLDPPLHEFLPDYKRAISQYYELRGSEGSGSANTAAVGNAKRVLESVERMSEHNPMIGFRGCRVGIVYPDIIGMQITALMEAACDCKRKGIAVHPEVMIPLVSTANELIEIKKAVSASASAVFDRYGFAIPYRYGTMIETPRACLTSSEIAKVAEFFSFGTNDLTQLTFGMGRDDSERDFLCAPYVSTGILPHNPFQQLDEAGVGALIKLSTDSARATHGRGVAMPIGICGEAGGEPNSIRFVHNAGLSYVSCSSYRVPVARLAVAHAAMSNPRPQFAVTVTPAAAVRL